LTERILFKPPWSPNLQKVAEGVWLLRGDIRHGMNVYLLEDDGGVTAFDSGSKPMVKAVKRAAEKLGGLKRVILGHSHSDHRGTAPYLGVPVFCHPVEAPWAAKPTWRENAPYWDIDLIDYAPGRWLYKHYFHNRWDGGAVKVAGTFSEGDEVCGFRVLDFPGHAPGQIALWRESDRVALTTDVVYFADSETFKEQDFPSVPHRAWNWDHQKAIKSVRKLAALDPALVLPGHGVPRPGPGLREQLERAADAG
jgi:glyoxylase-like metal-dependent hydrolase (beta-lactamase superfamily II)